MRHIKRSLVLILLILTAVLLVACGEEEKPVKIEPVQIEEVEGSEFNHVILTERAAERLGIETAVVLADEGVRVETGGDQWLVQQGEVTDPAEGLVRVTVEKSMLSRLDREQPARILLQDDDEEEEGFWAELFEPPDADDPGDVDEDGDEDEDEDEDEDGELIFMLGSTENSLTEGQSVVVELALIRGQQSVVPYSAVIYGLHGETWAYINPEPLTFIRHTIIIDYIEGGQAFLLDGPPAGTKVVTVGVAELYGADTGVGK
jgi:hypothetical protein